jgi:RNA polymerase sigma factor (TIGR02999 family)
MIDQADVTELVRAISSGAPDALPQLFAAVYAELKRLAHHQLQSGANPTASTTDLVHETYLKLMRPDVLHLNDRAHFFAVAASAMRQIMIDRARKHMAAKRGGAAPAAALDDNLVSDFADPQQLIHLDNALNRLRDHEPKLAELVELRYFAGLSVEQVAELRDVAPRTVLRDWRRARIYLFDETQSGAG